jgi:H+/gluconate symporter-like permease
MPAAEIIGKATVKEHFPNPEISCIAATRFNVSIVYDLFKAAKINENFYISHSAAGAFIFLGSSPPSPQPSR